MKACSCTILDLYAVLLGPVESAIARKPKLMVRNERPDQSAVSCPRDQEAGSGGRTG
jgi:hypothetical protein